jgi:hypothetical protein
MLVAAAASMAGPRPRCRSCAAPGAGGIAASSHGPAGADRGAGGGLAPSAWGRTPTAVIRGQWRTPSVVSKAATLHEDVNEAGQELTEYGPLRKRPREHIARARSSAIRCHLRQYQQPGR